MCIYICIYTYRCMLLVRAEWSRTGRRKKGLFPNLKAWWAGRAGKGRERCMHTKSRAARGGQVKGGWTYRVVVSMQAEGKRTKGYGPNQH